MRSISIYIDILLRWNSRINLTAVREPEEIVRRHFGESLFTARHLFPDPFDQPPTHVIDMGSGAGFPGLPIKLWFPQARVTLIESNHKKAAFLREVVRAVTLTDINVFAARAETYQGPLGNVVTLRAVEKFEAALPIAERLAAPGGQLALLIGEARAQTAVDLGKFVRWSKAIQLPESVSRILLVGTVNRSLQASG